MKADHKKQAGGRIQVTIELTPEEYQKIKTQAAVNVSQVKTLPGFRAGKAPYDVVAKYYGPDLEQEESLMAVKKYYLPYLEEQTWQTIGQPKIKHLSFNPFVFEVVSDILPEVKLGNWPKIKIQSQPVVVLPEKVDKVLHDLRNSRASEALTDRPVELGDRIIMDFTVSVDGVAVDGGAANDYSIIMGRSQLVLGFENNLIGAKAGETKKFELKFPDDYNKNLAGKEAQVTAKIKSVFKRALPEVNDEFAKNLGKFSSLKELKDRLEKNLHDEAAEAEVMRQERAMFDALLKVAEFEEIPESLVKNEVEQMINEFSQGITNQGLVFEDYLQSIKKSVDDLKKDFRDAGLKRVKTALIIRQIGQENKIEATNDQVEDELGHLLEHFASQPEVMAKLDAADYREHLKDTLTNQQVVKWLKDKLVLKSST